MFKMEFPMTRDRCMSKMSMPQWNFILINICRHNSSGFLTSRFQNMKIVFLMTATNWLPCPLILEETMRREECNTRIMHLC